MLPQAIVDNLQDISFSWAIMLLGFSRTPLLLWLPPQEDRSSTWSKVLLFGSRLRFCVPEQCSFTASSGRFSWTWRDCDRRPVERIYYHWFKCTYPSNVLKRAVNGVSMVATIMLLLFVPLGLLVASILSAGLATDRVALSNSPFCGRYIYSSNISTSSGTFIE